LQFVVLVVPVKQVSVEAKVSTTIIEILAFINNQNTNSKKALWSEQLRIFWTYKPQ
jgi:hypothetical protein